MLTVFAISSLILFIPVLFVRAAPEEAAAILTGIGIIVFGLYYPVVFGIAMAVVFLIITVWLGFDFARQVWCRSQRNQ
jgi:hypothetical protein